MSTSGDEDSRINRSVSSSNPELKNKVDSAYYFEIGGSRRRNLARTPPPLQPKKSREEGKNTSEVPLIDLFSS